jgi:hypothetical protein
MYNRCRNSVDIPPRFARGEACKCKMLEITIQLHPLESNPIFECSCHTVSRLILANGQILDACIHAKSLRSRSQLTGLGP